MTAAPRNTRSSARRSRSRRYVSAAALAVAFLAPAACNEAGEPEDAAVDGESSLPPYSAMAVTPSPPAADPEQLIGLSGEEITEKLGKPALIRREGTAEIWQYRRIQCVLDVFLYGNGRQVVEHVDLRDRGEATDVALKVCFQRMLEGALEST